MICMLNKVLHALTAFRGVEIAVEKTDSDKITIKIRVFANFREILGTNEVELKLTRKKTILEALQALNEVHPQGKQLYSIIINKRKKRLQSNIRIMVNDTLYTEKDNLEVPIPEDNSVIAIFPPVGGG